MKLNNVFVVHYHEIALKKGNRRLFENKLIDNIRNSLAEIEEVKIEKLPGRLLLSNYGSSTSIVKERLSKVSGIANFIPGFVVDNLEGLRKILLDKLKKKEFESFRILTKRGDKDFPKTSEEINREIGSLVQEKTGKKVDLENPEFTVYVEIVNNKVYCGFEKIQGIGGLPAGSSGKVLSLLSGGIDSPVSSFMMMTRGCQVDFIHFHSFPYLDRSSQEKTIELAKKLNQYQSGSKLYMVPFGDIQKEIVLKVSEKYRVVIYRRLMMKISNKIAEKEGLKALVTGESLGQVASQTLENMSVVNEASSLLILRPLVGMNKEEIISVARKIDTYDISIVPDQDCCQLFTPKHPATKSEIKSITQAESKLDCDKLVLNALERAEVKNY